MNTIQSSNSNEFKRLILELNNIVQINDVMTPPRGSDVTIKIEEEGGLASQIDLGNMSYGLQQILILLLAIMETEINETVCIEEPEIHLHATSQKRSLT
jgi:predicted ATPase